MLVKEPEIQNLINDTSNTSNDILLIVAIKWDGDLTMIHLLTKAGADWNKAVYENKSTCIGYISLFRACIQND